MDYEQVRIRGEGITPDLLIWRRYKRPAPGVREAFLAANPQIHDALGKGPFLPFNAVVKIPIFPEILNGATKMKSVVRLYGNT